MKKLITLITLLLSIFCFNTKTVKAQFINGRPGDFTELTNRPLIVQLMNEDTYYIDEINKKIEKTTKAEAKEVLRKELETYRSFIADYNKYIKEAVEKYWNFNKKKPIEYKSLSDVQVIRKNDPRGYAILVFHYTKLWVRNEYGKETYANHTIPTLIYSRLENCNPYDVKFYEKIDYSFYFPYIGMRQNNELMVTDFTLVFRIMHNHIKEILEKGKKDYKVVDFAKDQADEYCNEVKKQNFMIEDKILEKKVNKQEIAKVFTSNITIIPGVDVSDAITKDENYLVGISIPYDIKHDKSGIPGLEMAERIMYIKCFVEIKTGEIFSCYGDKAMDIWEPQFSTREFKKLEKCK